MAEKDLKTLLEDIKHGVDYMGIGEKRCELIAMCNQAIGKLPASDDISITKQHAFSLSELVKHYRKLIETMGKDNAPLTMAYCDELIKDLEK